MSGCLSSKPLREPTASFPSAQHSCTARAQPQEVDDEVKLGGGGQPPPSGQDSGLGRITREFPAPTVAGRSADAAEDALGSTGAQQPEHLPRCHGERQGWGRQAT